MRYLIVIGICFALMAGGVITESHSSMYWNFEPPDLETMAEPEAAPQDHRPALPSRQLPPQMYDDYDRPDIDPLSVDEPPSTAPLRATEDSVSATVSRPQTPRRNLQSAPQDAPAQTASPRPAITQPGGQREPAVRTEQSAAGAAVSAPPTDRGVQQPVTKKMKWGKTEAGSTEAPPSGSSATPQRPAGQ